MQVKLADRKFQCTGIPEIDTLEVKVSYTGDGNVGKGIALDHIILPYMQLGLSLAEQTPTVQEDMEPFLKNAVNLLVVGWNQRGGRVLRDHERQALQDHLEQWFADEVKDT